MTAENPATSIKSDYLLDNAWQHARERLALLEAGQDPGTIRYLEMVRVGPGWNCLEVGGGGGSIAEWLCHRVGPTGHVVATDIDTRFLDALDYANLEVRRHNIARDELAQDAFDLVHTRAVLSHLVERDTALTRIVAALKPGGWLLVEEPDLASMLPDPGMDAVAARVFNDMKTALMEVLAARGVDARYGRLLSVN
jgi:2-polyprenyl-3-methyl-5-hydroxy-6-metoxy-1,4-benzoquinol methylase